MKDPTRRVFSRHLPCHTCPTRWSEGGDRMDKGGVDWGTRERWRNGKRQRKDEAVRSLVPSVTFSLPSSMPYPFTSFSIHSFHVIGGEGRHEGRAISCLSSTLLQMKEQGKDKEKSHSFPVLSPTLYLLETNEVSGEEESERERKGSHVPEINRWRWEEISDMPSFSVSPVIHSGLLVVDGKERTEGGMRTERRQASNSLFSFPFPFLFFLFPFF